MIDTLIIDRGHATLDANKKYVTPGKQFKFPDGLQVYEGQENQKYCERIAHYGALAGFKIEYTILPCDPSDPSLGTRVSKANNSKNRKTALFISVHNNAGGGVGTEIFTSVGQTLSDTYAQGMLDKYKERFPTRKLRLDTRDGDGDKEENFYVLAKTSMPAVLIEFGFFDNRTDYEWLSNMKVIDMMARATVDGIVKAMVKLYGKEAVETRKFY